MEAAIAIPVVLACYALGCIVPSYYAVKWKTGVDLRKSGSGTVGATNAGRILGTRAYILLALVDIARGWLAPYSAACAGLGEGWRAAAAVAVVAGHLWPVQLKFHGGKGLAPAYGVILCYSPWTALIMWGVFGAAWLALRSRILGMVQAFLGAPLIGLGLGLPPLTCGLFFALAIIVSLTHRNNIRESLARRRGSPPSASETPAA